MSQRETKDEYIARLEAMVGVSRLDTRPETRAEPVACDCWREAMNRYRHGRNVRAACSCGDHPSNKWCDCPFCSVVLAQPTKPDAVEALREVMEWIKNWDPRFIYDDEWPETKAKVDRVLTTDEEEK